MSDSCKPAITVLQERNIILACTYEYRLPPPPDPETIKAGDENVIRDMTSRYLGLVVVPGKYVMKIEVEEFASQVKGRSSRWAVPEEEGF